MRRLSFLFFACLLICLQDGFSQIVKPWPIPSYNIPVNGTAFFQESSSQTENNLNRGRRKIHVQVLSQKTLDTLSCQATVHVYSLDGLDILGPYTVTCGSTLEVEIDEREWGALVESTYEIHVSVWIE